MVAEQSGIFARVVDVVVVGSGAAALVAATLAADGGSQVAVLEKADTFGGTTGVSGGAVWAPGNAHMAGAGVADSREEALAYIRRLTMGREPDPALLEVFVDTIAEAVAYLEDHTPLEMAVVPEMADYYRAYGIPGAKPEGRSIEPVPFPVGAELAEWAAVLTKRSRMRAHGTATTLAQDHHGVAATEQAEVARREREDVRPKGAALVAALFKGLLQRKVVPESRHAVRRLVRDGDEVLGVLGDGPEGPFSLGARQAVILGCGGFEWNPDLVRTFIGQELFPLSPPTNTGDGLVMAMAAGARLANMTSYWGNDAMLDPEILRDGVPEPQFAAGRGAAGTLIVNGAGRRFVNEAVVYNDFPRTFATFDPDGPWFPNEAPAWLILDEQARRTLSILSVPAGGPVPAWMHTGPDATALAGRIGVDPAALSETLARFNGHAARGRDADFARERPPAGGGPATLRALEPPLFAVAIYPGTIGTNGGARLDAHGRVCANGGGFVPGLYAAGNVAANVFGVAYPGGGATIANGITFGYLAGKHAATLARRSLRSGAPGNGPGQGPGAN